MALLPGRDLKGPRHNRNTICGYSDLKSYHQCLRWEEPRAEAPEGQVDQPKTSSEEADSLQREVEFEMIMFLREQNARLLAAVGPGSCAVEREGKATSSTTHEKMDAAMEQEPVPSPPGTPRSVGTMFTAMSPSQMVRYTPNATRIPD